MDTASQYIPKSEVRRLAKRSDLWGAWLTLHVWGVIALSATAFIIFPNPWVYAAAFLIIGSRQHGLAILAHDTAHGVLFETKTANELVGKYLLAAPYGGDMVSYRHYHLKHHRFTQSKQDPDLPLSAKFPTSRQSLFRKFLRDVTGLTFLRLRFAAYNMRKSGQSLPGSEAFQKTSPLPYLVSNGIIFGVFVLIGHPWLFLTLWLLPLWTWFFACLRLRNIAEHALTTNDDNPLTHARTTHANVFERILFAPYWVNYHVEHHAYMFVPCYRLKALHKAMIDAGHGPDMEMQNDYGAILKLASA
ncbi:MAG: fatty acid desaturase family protein [Litorimonas sp.]